ncbi:ATP-dependent DNA helicase [Halorubrum sp. AJ67]|uniref:ATP-dependent DNA helicase n=1 Tax=Halorubrum sp. AJ67 TaxID=1173487 RepID=UPI0003DC2216|nr:ATP-dependent DNA helicase [Halorubrum sp. AJ67]CDK38128.1 helicase / DNA excision repair protein ERCC-2 [Halorubrum sp. AJ67]
MATKFTGPRDYWADIFPFDSPYQKQTVGINEAVDTLKDNGVYLLEGECGTGKTLIALTAGLSLVRDRNTRFKRVFVVTSKKQQLRAFEDDLAAINSRNSYFRGLTLVGKADVCPYVDAGEIDRADLYHRCDELRDNTDRMMSEVVNDGGAERKADVGAGLASRAEAGDPRTDSLEAAGVKSPYRSELPEFLGKAYCPFFARHFVNDFTDRKAFDAGDGVTPEETLRNGVQAGTCPHAAMKHVVEECEVLIGNYQHILDTLTVQGFTGKLFTKDTLVVIDEAHELVSQARDQLSYSVSMETLDYAIQDVDMVLNWLDGKGHGGKAALVRSTVENAEYTQEDIKRLRWFLEKTRKLFTRRTVSHLKDEFGEGWQRSLSNRTLSEVSISAHEEVRPGEESDILREWMAEHGAEDDWHRILYLRFSVAYLREKVQKKIDKETPKGDFAIEQVREMLHRWLLGNHTEYYREVNLHPKDVRDTSHSGDRPWEAEYETEIRVNNCIPQDEIAATLDAFGGAIVMSATLEPIDVYQQVTGISKIEHGIQPFDSLVTKAASRFKNVQRNQGSARDVDAGLDEDDDEEEGDDGDSEDDEEDESSDWDPERRKRRVTTAVFDMNFPAENRASYAVELPKFTYSNRWPPEQNEQLRAQYRDTISAVVNTTPGNVLVFMPSYAEGEWAAEVLRDMDSVTKPILVDESSSDAETEALKREFVTGEPKVLTTSLRGTLTEGVDFSGDQLHGAVICGVPITNTGSEVATAIQDAYAERFGNWNGFNYAFTVPAVRKTRQALGRVIRGTEDVGVRVLADGRYTESAGRSSVLRHFPEHARDEFESVSGGELGDRLAEFWRGRRE